MRTIIPLLATLILLSSCVPLQDVLENGFGASSSSAVATSSSAPSETPIDLPVEIEEFSSSSTATGTGALAERMADHGILEAGMEDTPLLTVFTNYSCDYCGEFMRGMFPRLQSDFMMNGNLRVQFVIVPLKKYPNSVLEASALLCATAMEKGQAMHETILTAKLRDRKSLIALATKIGLPAKQFVSCLDAKETKNLLAEQQAFIVEYGITLIPTFLFGTQKQVGLPSYPDLRGWLRETLRRR